MAGYCGMNRKMRGPVAKSGHRVGVSPLMTRGGVAARSQRMTEAEKQRDFEALQLRDSTIVNHPF
ncbi:MAG: hypothetical protein AAF514_04615 [Verrucomicrobiota bacterium]